MTASAHQFDRVLPRVLDLATEVPLRPDDPLRGEVELERRELQEFYQFALHANAGEPEQAALLINKVLDRDPTTVTTCG